MGAGLSLVLAGTVCRRDEESWGQFTIRNNVGGGEAHDSDAAAAASFRLLKGCPRCAGRGFLSAPEPCRLDSIGPWLAGLAGLAGLLGCWVAWLVGPRG